MEEEYIGMIRIYAGNENPPDGYMFCEGQTLKISNHKLLFSILGTTYGGDGTSTFCLPNLQGSSIIGAGNRDRDTYAVGVQGGSETAVMTAENMPAHTHQAGAVAYQQCNNDYASTAEPTDSFFGVQRSGVPFVNSYSRTPSRWSTTDDIAGTINTGTTGSGESFYKQMEFVVLRYVICVMGNFPPKNN